MKNLPPPCSLVEFPLAHNSTPQCLPGYLERTTSNVTGMTIVLYSTSHINCRCSSLQRPAGSASPVTSWPPLQPFLPFLAHLIAITAVTAFVLFYVDGRQFNTNTCSLKIT